MSNKTYLTEGLTVHPLYAQMLEHADGQNGGSPTTESVAAFLLSKALTAARAVLRSAFNHLFYDVEKPTDGDETPMSTLIV